MIHLAALELEITLGRFHRVVSIQANQKYLMVQNSHDVEFLIPLYPPEGRRIQIHPFQFPTPPPAQGVVHLDHLEIHDVTRVHINPDSLTITTRPGLKFNWKVFPPCPCSPSSWTPATRPLTPPSAWPT